jgi:2-aminoadipate transaminase
LNDEWVCYVGSFSKILAPALRQGWVVVPPEYVSALSIAKEAADINSAPFTQRILTAYLETGRLPAHIDHLRGEYRRRRDAMIRALETHLPAGTRWQTPEAGLFLWAELPSRVRADEVLVRALEQGVAFLPGSAFGEGPDVAHALRLNFSHSSPATIEEGMARLGRAVGGPHD